MVGYPLDTRFAIKQRINELIKAILHGDNNYIFNIRRQKELDELLDKLATHKD